MGKCGADLTDEEAVEAARVVGLTMLATMRQQFGSLVGTPATPAAFRSIIFIYFFHPNFPAVCRYFLCPYITLRFLGTSETRSLLDVYVLLAQMWSQH